MSGKKLNKGSPSFQRFAGIVIKSGAVSPDELAQALNLDPARLEKWGQQAQGSQVTGIDAQHLYELLKAVVLRDEMNDKIAILLKAIAGKPDAGSAQGGKKRGRRSTTLRRRVAKLVIHSKRSISTVARDLNLKPEDVRRWVRRHRPKGQVQQWSEEQTKRCLAQLHAATGHKLSKGIVEGD